MSNVDFYSQKCHLLSQFWYNTSKYFTFMYLLINHIHILCQTNFSLHGPAIYEFQTQIPPISSDALLFIFCLHQMPQADYQLAFNVPLENWLLLANRLVKSSSLKSMRGSSILRRPQRTRSLSRSRREPVSDITPSLSVKNWRPTLLLWRPVAAHGEFFGAQNGASHLTWRWGFTTGFK